jgi:hypothetical protein
MIGRVAIHPILLAIFPILSLFQANRQFVRLQELLGPLLIAAGVTGAIWLALAAATRQGRRSAQSASVIIALVYGLSFGPPLASFVLSQLSVLWVRADVFVSLGALAAVLLPLGAFLLYRIWRKPHDPKGADGLLNLVGLVLVLLPAYQIARQEMAATGARPYRPEPLFGPSDIAAKARPHVFYIVVDGYARQDILRELFDLDNEPFLKELEARGFQVARRSNSNYMQTPLSLASSLNARYLGADDSDAFGSRDPLRDRIGKSAVSASLRGLGYRSVAFDSGFDLTYVPLDVDDFRTPRPRPTGFHEYLIEHSPLRWFRSERGGGSAFDQARERIEFAMAGMPEVAASDRPMFTFTHLVIPHPPFVFRADGSPYEKPGDLYHLVDGDNFKRSYGDEKLYIDGYRGQVEYLNGRLLKAIDAIVGAAPEPPVIVLQSDHGSGLHYWMNGVDETDLRERFANLTAVLLPPAEGPPIRQDITPVNLFRELFRRVFKAPVEELPEHCYFSTFNEPYTYIDVTARTRPAEPPTPASPETKPAPPRVP